MKTRGADWVSFCPLKSLCLPQVPAGQQENNYRNILSQLQIRTNRKKSIERRHLRQTLGFYVKRRHPTGTRVS
jgi:hypothetical protein